MTGYFIWVRETAAIKLHECISILKPKVSSLMTLTPVCPGNGCKNHLPRQFLVPQLCWVYERRDGIGQGLCYLVFLTQSWQIIA